MKNRKIFAHYGLDEQSLADAGVLTYGSNVKEVTTQVSDDRLLVKPVPAAVSRMPEALRELPYEGARPMLLVGNVDDREFLTELIGAMYEELPAPKPKKRRQALQEREK